MAINTIINGKWKNQAAITATVKIGCLNGIKSAQVLTAVVLQYECNTVKPDTNTQ